MPAPDVCRTFKQKLLLNLRIPCGPPRGLFTSLFWKAFLKASEKGPLEQAQFLHPPSPHLHCGDEADFRV